jgi:hypothetical protein
MKTYREFIEESKQFVPDGYRWDNKLKIFVPKKQKTHNAPHPEDETSENDASPTNGPAYASWGSSGYDGGYAIASSNI